MSNSRNSREKLEMEVKLHHVTSLSRFKLQVGMDAVIFFLTLISALIPQYKMVKSTDLHRVFIQTLLSRRFMREETALELYKRAVNVIKSMSHHHHSSFYHIYGSGVLTYQRSMTFTRQNTTRILLDWPPSCKRFLHC